MNKKLIKTIASIACGLGIVFVIPTLSTSCNKESNPWDDDSLVFANTTIEDFETHTSNEGISIENLKENSSKIDSWKKQKVNALVLPASPNNVNSYAGENTNADGIAIPDFITTLKLPKNIQYCENYFGSLIYGALPSQINKLIFECENFVINGGTFSQATKLQKVYFTNIKSFTRKEDYTYDLSKWGTAVNGKCEIIFGPKINNDDKPKIFAQLVALGLSKNIWTYNE